MATEKKDTKPVKAKAARPVKAPAVSAEAKSAGSAVERSSLEKRRMVVGVVMSDKMQKTITVKLDRRVRHDEYSKYITRSRKVKAHDETNSAKVGDLVRLVESRPLSRDKRWVLQNIVRRAGQAPEANV